MDKWLELINKLIAEVGTTMTLGEAKTWLEVEENAYKLLHEGHENDEPTNDNND